MAYLMHFNRNHDKKGRFTSGDGDGDGKFEYRIRLRKAGGRSGNGSGSDSGSGGGGSSSGNQWENAGSKARDAIARGPNGAKLKTERKSENYIHAPRNNKTVLRSTQRAIYNNASKTESRSLANNPVNQRVKEAFKNVTGTSTGSGRMTENKKIFTRGGEARIGTIDSEKYKEIEERLKTKNKDERAINDDKVETESTRTANYRKSAEEARSDAEWRQSIDRQTPGTYVDEAKLTAEESAKATVNYVLKRSVTKTINANKSEIEKAEDWVASIIKYKELTNH